MQTKISITFGMMFTISQLIGCGAALTSQGALVKVLASPDPTYCQPITSLTAQAGTRKDAETLLRNQAGEHHATAVHVEEAADASGQVHVKGKAYGCRTPAPHEQSNDHSMP